MRAHSSSICIQLHVNYKLWQMQAWFTNRMNHWLLILNVSNFIFTMCCQKQHFCFEYLIFTEVWKLYLLSIICSDLGVHTMSLMLVFSDVFWTTSGIFTPAGLCQQLIVGLVAARWKSKPFPSRCSGLVANNNYLKTIHGLGFSLGSWLTIEFPGRDALKLCIVFVFWHFGDG